MAETKDTTAKARAAAPASDGGVDALQRDVDAAEAKGYYGEVADPTPNRNYTVAGVVEGAETPETRAPEKGA